MAGDAIEVRESIEAKGDVDKDVEMEDAIDAAGDVVEEDAEADADADAEADPDAEGEVDADGEPDVDADGEPDDGDAQPARDTKDLLNLIDETQSYLSNYEEEYVSKIKPFSARYEEPN
jgi:chromatin structure-remodeling complex subunit RSC1/2